MRCLGLHHGGRFTPRASDGKVEYIGGEFDIGGSVHFTCELILFKFFNSF